MKITTKTPRHEGKAKVYGRQILFGKPATLPTIRGFEVLAQRGTWMLARQGVREFFVEVRPNGRRLFPRNAKGQACTDQAVFVPADSGFVSSSLRGENGKVAA